MLFDDHQVLEHIKRVSVRLQGENALLLGVHLEEAVVVQTHDLGLQPVLAPQVHSRPTEKTDTGDECQFTLKCSVRPSILWNLPCYHEMGLDQEHRKLEMQTVSETFTFFFFFWLVGKNSSSTFDF